MARPATSHAMPWPWPHLQGGIGIRRLSLDASPWLLEKRLGGLGPRVSERWSQCVHRSLSAATATGNPFFLRTSTELKLGLIFAESSLHLAKVYQASPKVATTAPPEPVGSRDKHAILQMPSHRPTPNSSASARPTPTPTPTPTLLVLLLSSFLVLTCCPTATRTTTPPPSPATTTTMTPISTILHTASPASG